MSPVGKKWPVITRRAMLSIAATLCVAFSTSEAAKSEEAPKQTYRYFVFSNPTAGQEEEYNRWYEHQHIGDVLSAKDFVEARRYIYAEDQLFVRPDIPQMPRYLVVYTIVTDDIDAVMEDVAERIRTGKTVPSPSYDRSTSQSMLYRDTPHAFVNPSPVDPAPASAGSQKQDYLHFVFTAAVPGREAEFDDWYVTKHLHEAGSSPGFYASRRLELARPSRANPPPTRYVATFEARTADFKVVIDEYKRRSPQRSHTDSLERNLTRGYTYRAIGPVVTRDEVLALREAAAKEAR
jgi:hypothetical protein